MTKVLEIWAVYSGGAAASSSSCANWSRKVAVIPRRWLPGQ